MGKPEDPPAETDIEIDIKNSNSDATTKEVPSQTPSYFDEEHQLSLIQGLKLYPTSVLWSAFFSMGVIMTAFDPQLLGSLFATPAFQKDFGYLYEGSWIISAPWQTALGMGNPIGQVVGALAAGYPMEWWGRRPVSFFLPRRTLNSNLEDSLLIKNKYRHL